MNQCEVQQPSVSSSNRSHGQLLVTLKCLASHMRPIQIGVKVLWALPSPQNWELSHPIQLAIVINRADFRFKFQNWSWDAKVVGDQSKDSFPHYVIT